MKFYNYLAVVLFVLPQFILGQNIQERLQIDWPQEYEWKLITNQHSDSAQVLQVIPQKEDVTKWTIMGQVAANKGLSVDKMEDAMNEFIKSARVESPKAKLTRLEGNNSTDNPWILFKIEAESFMNDPKPESQLYYLVQSGSYFYSSFVALKEKKLSNEFVKKWSQIFKSSKIVTGQVLLEQPYQRYYDEIEKFSIEFPQHWKYVKQENKPIKLIVYRTKEAIGDIPRENINLNFISEPDSNVDEGYAKLKNALLKGGSQLVEEGEFNIDDKKVKWMIETHQNTVSGEAMKNYSFTYYSKNRIIVMTCTALVNTFEKHKETFEKIARSFKI
jgi:hypothetical protein